MRVNIENCAKNGKPIEKAITAGIVKVERKNRGAKTVQTPNFIFCIGDTEPLPMGKDDQRYGWIAGRNSVLVRLGARGA